MERLWLEAVKPKEFPIESSAGAVKCSEVRNYRYKTWSTAAAVLPPRSPKSRLTQAGRTRLAVLLWERALVLRGSSCVVAWAARESVCTRMLLGDATSGDERCGGGQHRELLRLLSQ